MSLASIGEPTCVIPLGANGQYEAIVSQQDYAILTKHRWNYKKSSWKYGQKVYARRGGGTDPNGGGCRPTVLMHVFILEVLMGEERPDELATVHHKDGNSLNNTRGNLCWASKSEQSKYQKPRITAEEKAEYDRKQKRRKAA